MKVIYICGPFRADNAWEREQNVRRAEAAALDVWKVGQAAICPHTNTRFFQGAAPDKLWLEGDLEILKRCDAVLCTPDFYRSKGATAEVDAAHGWNIPVFHSMPELLVWLKEKGAIRLNIV